MGKRLSLVACLLLLIGVSSVYSQDVDTDGDGMSDAWETQYGLNPRNRFDANLDLDGDKIRNIDEFKAGTNPNDRDIDKNGDGVADDWMKFYGLSDASADTDGDGMSNKDEYNAGTVPTDPESVVKQETVVATTRQTPSMVGIRENVDASIPENHQVAPNVFRYNDPIGDDKGPGYYTYPTNPVYAPGAFDIVSFEVDATARDNIVFKITVNADLKQDWGMAADFDVQHFQIYIDQDNVPGSGEVRCIPGLNVFFDPNSAWDRVVIVSSQPNSRVQVEIDVKAKDMASSVAIPIKITGQGRTITAVVKRKDLGVAADADISGWAYQVVAQSNEGFPDSDDMLTRNVNEFRGLHRFGGGSDYWGDPELMDILVWPARGTMQEATDQFAMLNVWSSSPNPMMDVKAVLPLVRNNQAEQWMPQGGYEAFAKNISEKLKPPPQKDKYVSDNFTFSGSVNAQWYYNLDNVTAEVTHPEVFGGGGLNQTFKPETYYDNHIYSRFTLEWYGKVFTDLLNFYARLSTWWGPDAQWDYWQGNYYRDTHGPQYVSLDFESFRFQIVKPLPTIDYVSIGNYEYGLDAWTVGAASYPDRDKYKGIFIDGSTEVMKIIYNVGYFYPFPWLGIDWGLGDYTSRDNVLSGLFKIEPFKFLKLQTTAFLYSDWELGEINTNTGLRGLARRMQNYAVDGKMELNFNALNTGIGLDVIGGTATIIRGTNLASHTVEEGVALSFPAGVSNLTGYFGVATVKLNNILGSGLKFLGQGFYVKDYFSMMAARGDYGNAARHDVLAMYGNQSPSSYPQDDSKFQKYDAVMWEGVANGGWYGGTGILELTAGLLNVHTEFSIWGFNDTNWNQLPDGDITNGQITEHPTNSSIDVTNNTIAYGVRGYATVGYKLDIGNGLELKLSYLYNQTKNWWPFAATSHTREGMTGVFNFTYGFIYEDHLAKIMAYYQVSSLFKAGLGFQYRHDLIHDLYPSTDQPTYTVNGYTLILDLSYTVPLGTIRTYIQGYKADNPSGVLYGGHSYDFRVPFEYHGLEYNVVALTELDIYF